MFVLYICNGGNPITLSIKWIGRFNLVFNCKFSYLCQQNQFGFFDQFEFFDISKDIMVDIIDLINKTLELL